MIGTLNLEANSFWRTAKLDCGFVCRSSTGGSISSSDSSRLTSDGPVENTGVLLASSVSEYSDKLLEDC